MLGTLSFVQLKEILGEVDTVQGAKHIPLVGAVEALIPDAVQLVSQGFHKLLNVSLLDLLQPSNLYVKVSEGL